MARGGYRQPPPGQPPSGPGRFSRRTDGNQPPRTPGLTGSDLQYGDVGKLQAGQRAVPIPKGGAPAQGAPAGEPPPLVPPGQDGGGGLADFVTQTPSNRPGEPITAGLDMGPGPGSDSLRTLPPDDRQAVLHYLATTYGNQDALEMLNEMRGVAAANGAAPPGPAAAAPNPAAPSAGPAEAGSPPAGGRGGALDDFLLGDDPNANIAEPPVPEQAEPLGPSTPLPAQT